MRPAATAVAAAAALALLGTALPPAARAQAPAQAPAQAIAEVQVTPERMTLRVGQKQPIFAVAYDRQGNLVSKARFVYASSAPAVVRVAADGTVLGLRPGAARIEARAGGRRAAIAVQVTGAVSRPGAARPDGRPDSVLTRSQKAPGTAPVLRPTATVLTLDPPAVYLLPSENLRLAVHALRDDGSPADPVRVVWRSLRPEIATVDSTGLVVGVAPGQAIIQAEGPAGLAATAPVVVEQVDFALTGTRVVLGPDQVDTLRAVIPTQGGRELRTGLAWRSSDTTVVRVGPTGILQARAPGTAEIVVTGFFQERHVPVRVHALPVAMVVSPRPAMPIRLPLRATHTFAARAQAADSTPIPEAQIDWAVGDTAVAAFDPAAGRLTARAIGTTTLTARLAGFTPAVWTIEVIPGRIAVDHPRLGLAVGGRAPLAAALLGADGKPLGPVGEARWTSSRADVAAVGPDGLVTGAAPGRAVVTATAPWGERDSAEVLVSGELLVASNRDGGFAIYGGRAAAPDSAALLLADGATAVQAALSPDRTRIAYTSNRSGAYALWLMDADGRNPHRITDGPGDGEPAWTPDGSRLVFASSRSGVPQIYSVRPDGSDLRVLTSSGGGNLSPAVSPDGRTIAFVSLRGGEAAVWLMNADGTEQRRLATGGDRESAPRWFPNGDVAYAVQKGKGGRILRATPGAATPPLLLATTDRPVAALAVSRDGRRLVYAVARTVDGGRGRTQFALYLQDAVPGAVPVALPLRADEQIASLDF